VCGRKGGGVTNGVIGEMVRAIGRRVRRFLIALGLIALAAYATVGFVRQERIVRQLSAEVAVRQQERDDALREQAALQAELAALNDPARYSQYATLVARHTLMLARPDETLLIVTWKTDGATSSTTPAATDWNALLRAAGIPTP
jgi:cell division protein FtsB